jgi:NADH-quinone oxidoreductase subunit L
MPGFFPNMYYGILLAPLLGFVINALLGKKLPKPLSGGLATLAVFIPFLITCLVFVDLTQGLQMINANLYNWFSVGGYRVNYGFLLDNLSVIMILIITGVGSLIHLYSMGYMHDDEKYSTYFSYLNLFVFFMLMLVMSNNYLGMFIGWEGVGLSSYLLIGFWFKNQDYNDAAKKAFIMNRVGDLGFLLGIFFLFFYVGTLEYHSVNKFLQVSPLPTEIVTIIALLFFIGAMGKSAQIPLFTWLPDAMAGPTPVSALIHAATMVTAGIYMIIRSNLLYSLAPVALEVVAIVGIATALYAAIIGLMQNDIKKVLAYSTVSQLGLMFLALGVGAYTTALFHVMTHAFFKALLFLGAGSVIHAMSGEQDIRKMGGLRKALPITFATFLIGSLAISGIPPFSGFFSKDEILAKAFEQHQYVLWSLGVAVSMMTAFYMFRLLFLTFSGDFRGTSEQKHHLHESPLTMTIPLMVLALLATVGGFVGLPHVFHVPHYFNEFLDPVIYELSGNAAAHAHLSVSTEWTLMGIAVAGALFSIGLAFSMYVKGKQMPSDDQQYSGLGKVIYNKMYIDEIYDALFVKPVQKVSEILYKVVDQILIDGIVNLTAKVTMTSGNIIRSIQTGHSAFYILAMVLTLIFILGYFLISQ